jgi:hypothetical protein
MMDRKSMATPMTTHLRKLCDGIDISLQRAPCASIWLSHDRIIGLQHNMQVPMLWYK